MGAAVDFVSEALQPTLTKGLVELCRARPDDPVSWLANWMLENKPAPSLAKEGTAAADEWEGGASLKVTLPLRDDCIAFASAAASSASVGIASPPDAAAGEVLCRAAP